MTNRTVTVDRDALVDLQVEVYRLEREAHELHATIGDLRIDNVVLEGQHEDDERALDDIAWRQAQERRARERVGRHDHDDAVQLLIRIDEARDHHEDEERADARRRVVLG